MTGQQYFFITSEQFDDYFGRKYFIFLKQIEMKTYCLLKRTDCFIFATTKRDR